MSKRDVINTYIANLNKYKHLLSLNEQIYDNKKFKEHIRKNYNYRDENKLSFNTLFVYMVLSIYYLMYYNKYY